MGNSIQDMITAAALQQGIDPRWALATAQTESNFQPNAVSSAGAQGVMQLMPATARALGVTNPLDPAQNIKGGVTLLKQDLQRYGNPVAASAAYFGGTAPGKWGTGTAQYVSKVKGAFQKMAQPAAQPTQSANQPDDGFNAWYEQNTNPQSSASGPQAPGSANSGAGTSGSSGDSGFDKWFADNTNTTPNAAQPATPQQVADALTPAQNIKVNLERGLEMAFNPINEAIARGVGDVYHVAGGDPNWKPGQIYQNDANQENQAFQTYLGNQKPLSLGNIVNVGTQLGAGALALATGEGAINAGARAVGQAIPVAAPAIEGAARFLTGRAGQFTGAGAKGALTKVGSMAAQGALQVPAFDAMTGRPITPGQVVLGAAANPIIGGASTLAGNAVRGILSGAQPVEQRAARAVLNAAQADGGVPAAAASGPGDTLATTGGPNVQGLAEQLANRPGPGRSIVSDYFSNLMDQQPQVLAQAIKGAMGSNGSVSDLVANVMQQRSQQAAPKFQAVFSRIQPTPQEIAPLQPLIDSPEGQKAAATALTTMRRSALGHGQIFNPADYGFVQNGNKLGVAPDQLSMPALHGIKEGFDDNIEALRDPVTGKLPNTKEVNALAAMRDRFRSLLTQQFPRYQGALDAWSGPSKAIDAARLGAKVLSTDTDLTAQRVAAMDPSEKAAFQAGVAQSVLNKIGSVQDGGKVARMFATPNVRAKIAAAFNSPQEADQFMSMAERLNEQANARNAVMGNSRTALRQAQQGHDWGKTAMEAGANALAGRPHIAAMRLLQGLTGHAAAQGNPDYDTALANLLTNQNMAAVASRLQAAQPGAFSQGAAALAGGANRAARLSPLLGMQPNALTGTGQ